MIYGTANPNFAILVPCILVHVHVLSWGLTLLKRGSLIGRVPAPTVHDTFKIPGRRIDYDVSPKC